MPPPTASFSVPALISLIPGALSSALNRVLTPVMTVNGTFFSSLTKPGMSRGFVIRTLCAPSFMKVSRLAVSENT